jgi:hypothetical protein
VIFILLLPSLSPTGEGRKNFGEATIKSVDKEHKIRIMESNTFIMPIGGKSILRSTGEEVEIIDSYLPNRGTRTEPNPLLHKEGDWVTYIDSEGKEHIKEHLNIQLDFKPVVNDTWNKVFDFAKNNKMPTTRNSRIFEVAKELVKNGSHVSTAVSVARQLVDEVGVETE